MQAWLVGSTVPRPPSCSCSSLTSLMASSHCCQCSLFFTGRHRWQNPAPCRFSSIPCWLQLPVNLWKQAAELSVLSLFLSPLHSSFPLSSLVANGRRARAKMGALSSVGVGLAVVSSLLLLALTAELYYIFVHKRRQRRRAAAVSDAASSPSSSSRELLQLFCFKKPPPELASTYAVPEPTSAVAVSVGADGADDDETVEAQLMRLGSVVGPTRLLFTIKEETREDLESEDGGRGRSRSLGELLHCAETPPFLTPRASPSPVPTAAMGNSYNPLFESPAASPGPVPAPTVSPPPKFQFLRDAEDKLYRRALAQEEAMRARRSPTSPAAAAEEDGGYITIVVEKNNRVIPMPSPSPPTAAAGHQ